MYITDRQPSDHLSIYARSISGILLVQNRPVFFWKKKEKRKAERFVTKKEDIKIYTFDMNSEGRYCIRGWIYLSTYLTYLPVYLSKYR